MSLPSDSVDQPTVRVASIFVGRPREYPNDGRHGGPPGPVWTTSFAKAEVTGRVALHSKNLEGDGQADLVNHGGVDKAVLAYPSEHYAFWRRQRGLEQSAPAKFGENFSVVGLTEAAVCVGDVWEVGSARLQVSQPRQPCWKMARFLDLPGLPGAVRKTGRTGWYLRVVATGEVAPGDPITVTERPHPDWSIANANTTYYQRADDRTLTRALAECPALSQDWVDMLRARLSRRS